MYLEWSCNYITWISTCIDIGKYYQRETKQTLGRVFTEVNPEAARSTEKKHQTELVKPGKFTIGWVKMLTKF